MPDKQSQHSSSKSTSNTAQRGPGPNSAAVAPPAAQNHTGLPDRLKTGVKQLSGWYIVQPKLMVGPANDRYEQEADRVAAQVMSAPSAPVAQRAIKDEDELQTETMLQRSSEGFEAGADFERHLNNARSGGSPLPNDIRQFMEQRIGADFGRVRVHTDAQAHQLNNAIQAKAFTTGQNIFFREGAYAPSSTDGKALLAHELTHVVQQGAINKPLASPSHDQNGRPWMPKAKLLQNPQTKSLEMIQRQELTVSNSQGKWEIKGRPPFLHYVHNVLIEKYGAETGQNNLNINNFKPGDYGLDRCHIISWYHIREMVQEYLNGQINYKKLIACINDLYQGESTQEYFNAKKSADDLHYALVHKRATHTMIEDLCIKLNSATPNLRLDYATPNRIIKEHFDPDLWKDIGGIYHMTDEAKQVQDTFKVSALLTPRRGRVYSSYSQQPIDARSLSPDTRKRLF